MNEVVADIIADLLNAPILVDMVEHDSHNWRRHTHKRQNGDIEQYDYCIRCFKRR